MENKSVPFLLAFLLASRPYGIKRSIGPEREREREEHRARLPEEHREEHRARSIGPGFQVAKMKYSVGRVSI